MRLHEYINRILAGCGMEDRKMELQGILHQISEEYHSGNITDEELQALIKDICKSIVSLAKACGKQYTLKQCTEELTNIISEEVPSSIIRAVQQKLAKIKARKRGLGGTGGLL